MATGFTRHNFSGVQRWAREDGGAHVAFYPRFGDRPGIFYVYRTVGEAPKGRTPWTVNNKRVAEEKTLRRAIEIAKAA